MKVQEIKRLATLLFTLRYGKKPLQTRKVRNKKEFVFTFISNYKNSHTTIDVRYRKKYKTIQLFSSNTLFGINNVQTMSVNELLTHEKFGTTKADLDIMFKAKYTIDELIEGLENKTIKIDTQGHNMTMKGGNKWFKKNMKERIIKMRDDTNKRKDPDFWRDSKTKSNSGKVVTPEDKISNEDIALRLAERYLNFSTEKIMNNYNIGAMDSPDMHCHNCGNAHKMILVGDTLTLSPTYSQEKNGNVDASCVFSKGLKPKTVNLDIPSGDIVFQNYFMVKDQERNDDTVYEPKEGRYSEYSVSDHLGRTNRMKKLAKSGIGYGQMGNMSLGLYVNPERTKIILGDTSPDEDMRAIIDPDYTKAMKEGFVMSGTLSLAVWAYYCVDKANMVKYNTDDLEKGYDTVIESKNGASHDYGERLIANVKKGTWKLTHFYDNTPDPKKGRLFKYATLDLVK